MFRAQKQDLESMNLNKFKHQVLHQLVIPQVSKAGLESLQKLLKFHLTMLEKDGLIFMKLRKKLTNLENLRNF
jgi:hypothetical protein